jgi:hypothetical protein
MRSPHITSLIVRLLWGLIVGTAIAMLFVQMHMLNIHLSDFRNTVEEYIEQQLKFRTHQYHHHQKHGQSYGHRIQQDLSDRLIDDNDSSGDLGPILRILQQAGYDISDHEVIQRPSLPSWSKIIKAYGQPTILGLETCKQFRDNLDPSLRTIGVAGLFNSGTYKRFSVSVSCTDYFLRLQGTNLLHGLLRRNCRHPDPVHLFKSNILWQVWLVLDIQVQNVDFFLKVFL